MSTEAKVDFVASVRDEYGLGPALVVAELPRSTWYYHQNEKVSLEEKYAHLRPLLEEIARQHPEYGYRRTRIELAENYGHAHGEELIRRLHQQWQLNILHATHPPQPSRVYQAITEAGDRANMVAQKDGIGLFEVAYTDFTEMRFAGGARKAYLMPIIGHRCKFVYGWALSERANTKAALTAWQQAKVTLQQLAIDYQGMIIHHDQDPVYTSYRWTGQLLLKDNMRISYALGGARDNPEMESFFGRFKTEGHSLFLEAATLGELRHVVDGRMRYYNYERRHSSIGYRSPLAFIEQARHEASC